MKISLYARVSTDEQKEGKTIESQINDLRKYAKEQNYNIVSEHFDDGWTGSILERPELDKVRDEAKNGVFDTLLIHHPDRLSRVQLHQLLLLDEFERQNIKVLFYKLPEFADQSEESRIVNKSVWSMVSELERLRIRERTRRGKRNKAEKGIIVGHKPPFGYKYIKADKGNRNGGHYEINDNEAIIVQKIFELAKKGLSLRNIIRELYLLKFSRRIKPKDRDKKIWSWTTSSIHKILHNETYTGITYYNKFESIEAKNPTSNKKYKRISKTSRKLRDRSDWIPIQLPNELILVSKTDYDLVQTQLKKNKTFSLRNTKHKYLLRGLLKCGKCGYKYYADTSHGYPIYRDSNKFNKFPLEKTCISKQVSANSIDTLVWETITNAVLNPEIILKEAQVYDAKNKLDLSGNYINTKLEGIKNQEQRLISGYQEGVIELPQLKVEIQRLRLLKNRLEAENKPIQKTSVSLISRSVNILCKQLKKVLQRLSFEDKQKVLRLILDNVTIINNKIVVTGILPIISKNEANPSIMFPTSL